MPLLRTLRSKDLLVWTSGEGSIHRLPSLWMPYAHQDTPEDGFVSTG